MMVRTHTPYVSTLIQEVSLMKHCLHLSSKDGQILKIRNMYMYGAASNKKNMSRLNTEIFSYCAKMTYVTKSHNI